MSVIGAVVLPATWADDFFRLRASSTVITTEGNLVIFTRMGSPLERIIITREDWLNISLFLDDHPVLRPPAAQEN